MSQERPVDLDQSPAIADWQQPLDGSKLANHPVEAVVANVVGRRVSGPRLGFGQLWLKTYEVSLCDKALDANEVCQIWRANIPSFWPRGNRIYFAPPGIQLGAVGVINLSGPLGLPVYTGVRVSGVTDTSWTFTTLQGHMFAGVISFSARAEGDCVIAQVQATVSPHDPLWEVSMRLFGYRREDSFWASNLQSLAARLGLKGEVRMSSRLLGKGLRWRGIANLRYNAALGSLAHRVLRPFRGRQAQAHAGG